MNNSIGFGEEIEKLCKKMFYVNMIIWSADLIHPLNATYASCYTVKAVLLVSV